MNTLDPLLFDLAYRMAAADVDYFIGGVPAALTEAIRDAVKLDEPTATAVARIVLDGMHAMRAASLHNRAETQHAIEVDDDYSDCSFG